RRAGGAPTRGAGAGGARARAPGGRAAPAGRSRGRRARSRAVARALRLAVVLPVVAAVEVEIAPAEVHVVDDGAEDLRARVRELIAGAAHELARRVVTLHHEHDAVGLPPEQCGVGHG